jgi:diguanylate cyclase (GGDEF)-like protein
MSKTTKTLMAIWLVIVAFVAFLITDLVAARRLAEEHIRTQALSYVRVVEQHASAALDRANIALIGVTDHLLPSDLVAGGQLPEARRKEIESLLMLQQSRTAGIVSIFVTDADGTTVVNSLGNAQGSGLGDRKYFLALKDRPGASVAISEAVKGRSSNKWGVVLARAIESPGGAFGGMVGANLGLAETFTDFYATLSIGERGMVSLRDADNRLLVRYPVLEEQLGRQAPASVLAKHLQAGDIEGVNVATSALDNVERFFGFRKLEAYPVYAVVGYAAEDAFYAWRIERNSVAVAILLVISAGAYITFVLRRMEQAEAELRIALEDQATHDLLTGLPNRRFAFAWLPYALSSAKRDHKKLAVLFVDLDDFKEINDELGHEAGDLVLKTVAERFLNTIRGSDVLVRHGGDEFLVLVQAAESREELATLSTRLIASLETKLHAKARVAQVSASIGIALYPDNAEDARGLIDAADAAMYQVKRYGGRHYKFSESTADGLAMA